MNVKEQRILQLIQENPFITQNELADKLELSRPAVANYISSLTKKGKIVGRAYVLPKDKHITCIGGANVDRKSQVMGSPQYGTSNPVTSFKSTGGVARNIAENLGRLESSVSLLTLLGDDSEGDWLLEKSKPYMDMSLSYKMPNNNTGAYTAVIDNEGEMVIALSEMSIMDQMEVSHVQKKWGRVAGSDFILMDTNLPSDVIEYIIKQSNINAIPVCIASVSSPKIHKIPENCLGVTWLILNRDEAETLTGITLSDEKSFKKAAKMMIAKGIEYIVITLGDKGVFYFTKQGETEFIHPPSTIVQDVTGAGDSLIAGLVYATIHGENIQSACKYGMSCSAITLQTNETVHSELNKNVLHEVYKTYFEGNEQHET
ncbi:carbohydrate kinase [Chengkuizengella axinellae]|uniref:Winged helix-turn-helix transcriptional regulator n=1 Tax=Chengkuizengella axinellae TaxID=3064388 RepID=A0ABT9IWV4_9BACL|nr:carbohydrate kinase [Chengkuizengella sp. 2205SS18-9]MDP5273851.1 winged helix-turn-helix transcriptional regulator [Chengkuizengella sp. 2205SS18-9]